MLDYRSVLFFAEGVEFGQQWALLLTCLNGTDDGASASWPEAGALFTHPRVFRNLEMFF